MSARSKRSSDEKTVEQEEIEKIVEILDRVVIRHEGLKRKKLDEISSLFPTSVKREVLVKNFIEYFSPVSPIFPCTEESLNWLSPENRKILLK